MTEQPHQSAAQSVSARLAKIDEAPSRRAAAAAGPRSSPTRTRRPRATKPDADPTPAEAADVRFSERLSITTTREQLKALRAARLDDGIEATARLRALIAEWMHDPELRDRINQTARDWIERKERKR